MDNANKINPKDLADALRNNVGVLNQMRQDAERMGLTVEFIDDTYSSRTRPSVLTVRIYEQTNY